MYKNISLSSPYMLQQIFKTKWDTEVDSEWNDVIDLLYHIQNHQTTQKLYIIVSV